MKTTILGIRIPLPTEQVERPELGIYTASGQSEIRWSEAPLVGVAETWTHGLIAPDGIGEFVQRADLRRGGGVAVVDSTTIVIDNTDQMSLKLSELGIYLDGLTAIVEEFVGTELDSDAESRTTEFTGTMEGVQWNDKRLRIPVNSSLSRQRRANIATVVNSSNRDDLDGEMEGRIVPVSFGRSDPDSNRHFKLVRTTAKEKVLNVEDIAQFEGEYYPPNMNLFPVAEVDENAVTIRIGSLDGTALTQAKLDALLTKYVKFVEGKSGNNGVYRKITGPVGSAALGGNEKAIDLTLRDYTPADPPGNYDGIATDQTWVQILDIDRDYEIDTFDCKGFEADPTLYAKTEKDRIIQIPPYGLNIDTVANNRLKIDPLHFKDNPNNASSFIAVPVESVSLYDAPDLGAFNSAGDTSWGNFYIYKHWDPESPDPENPDFLSVPGFYWDTETGIFPLPGYEFGNPENVKDKKYDTYCLHRYQTTDIMGPHIKALEIRLPPRPRDFTRAYLVVKITENYRAETGTPSMWKKSVQVLKRGYIDRVGNVTEEIELKTQDGAVDSTVDSVPDFYYSPPPETQNKNFYRQSEADGGEKYSLYSGYERFPLSEGPTDYDAIEEVLLALRRSDMNAAGWDETKIYQVAVVFETTADIEGEVYV